MALFAILRLTSSSLIRFRPLCLELRFFSTWHPRRTPVLRARRRDKEELREGKAEEEGGNGTVLVKDGSEYGGWDGTIVATELHKEAKEAYNLHGVCDVDASRPCPPGRAGWAQDSALKELMQNIMERYKMHLGDLSSNNSATEQNIQHGKQKAALYAKQIEFLEASKRLLMGENLESCSLEDLYKLECQLDQGLRIINGIKVQLLSGQVTQLKEKARVLSEENEVLHNQCKETKLILDSTRLVALQDNNNQSEYTDIIETDLCIGWPGRGKI